MRSSPKISVVTLKGSSRELKYFWISLPTLVRSPEDMPVFNEIWYLSNPFWYKPMSLMAQVTVLDSIKRGMQITNDMI